jgi:TolB-like protein
MPALPTPPSQMIQEELERLAASDVLRRAPSHLRLLRYLVEKRLAGDEAALREAAIALDVFKRDPSTYDPRVDPIVRVNIGRLRDRLASHYADFDRPPKLRIVLPKGRYAPEFVADPANPFTPSGVAVLTTVNRAGGTELDPWCLALTERLTDALAQAGIERVVARSSVAATEADTADTAAIGRRLGVLWLIASTLEREPDGSLRATVRLLNAADTSVSWAEQRVRPAADRYLLADRLIDHAVARICASLAAPPKPPAEGTIRALSADQRAALDTARVLLVRRTVEATDEAIRLVEPVTAERPDSAAAWAMLASCQYSRMTFQDRGIQPLIGPLRQANAKALALDPDDPVALRTEAILIGKCDFDLPRAEALYARVLRVLPNYTSARLNGAEALWLQGRFDEALAEVDLALVYDPLSAAARSARAACLCLMRRHDEARQEWAIFRATGETSIWGLFGAAQNELHAGHVATAARLLDEALVKLPGLPFLQFTRGIAHAFAGEADAASACERDCLRQAPDSLLPTQRAGLAAALRDKRGVLALLEQGLSERDMHFLYAGIDPTFEWLANDPDFLALLNRGGIPCWRGVRREAATP